MTSATTEPGPGAPAADRAEAIRLELADAWGTMGASWGVAPAIARVHAYLMARGEPLTEREVREALGLSHRAASLALDAAVGWGVVEKVPEPRRVGRRGPAGTAYLAVGDHFRWFSRVIAHRKRLEGDPIIAVLERDAPRRRRGRPGPSGGRRAARSAGLAGHIPRVRPPVRPGDRARARRRADRARADPRPAGQAAGRDPAAARRPAPRAPRRRRPVARRTGSAGCRQPPPVGPRS